MVLEEGEIIKQFNVLLKNFSGLKNFKEIGEIKSLDEIRNIPPTIREDLDNWKAEDAPLKPYCIHVTSGSRGKNIPIFYSKSAWENLIKRGVYLFKYLKMDESE